MGELLLVLGKIAEMIDYWRFNSLATRFSELSRFAFLYTQAALQVISGCFFQHISSTILLELAECMREGKIEVGRAWGGEGCV